MNGHWRYKMQFARTGAIVGRVCHTLKVNAFSFYNSNPWIVVLYWNPYSMLCLVRCSREAIQRVFLSPNFSYDRFCRFFIPVAL